MPLDFAGHLIAAGHLILSPQGQGDRAYASRDPTSAVVIPAERSS
jgi:hypothetical protein